MHWQDYPYRMSVKKGESKAFCKCGQTKNPPFCDGSHAGTGVAPYRETFQEDKNISICGCGKSKKMPYCDGSHACKTQ